MAYECMLCRRFFQGGFDLLYGIDVGYADDIEIQGAKLADRGFQYRFTGFTNRFRHDVNDWCLDYDVYPLLPSARSTMRRARFVFVKRPTIS